MAAPVRHYSRFAHDNRPTWSIINTHKAYSIGLLTGIDLEIATKKQLHCPYYGLESRLFGILDRQVPRLFGIPNHRVR